MLANLVQLVVGTLVERYQTHETGATEEKADPYWLILLYSADITDGWYFLVHAAENDPISVVRTY